MWGRAGEGLCCELCSRVRWDEKADLFWHQPTSVGPAAVGKMMLTVHGMLPQKANGHSALGQSHPSRQWLPEAGSRMSLSSHLGPFQTSQSHLKLISHNKPRTENHSEEGWGAGKLTCRCPLGNEKTIWQRQVSRTGWELVSPSWADVSCRPPHASFPSCC